MAEVMHINDIKLVGDDAFSQRFNYNSELWQKAHDMSLSEETRQEWFQRWFEDRQMLEMGY